MSVFFIRLFLTLVLFLFGALVGAFTDKSYLALGIWFTALSVWTLQLGFRKALFILIPFLIISDVFWDGTLGALFLSGFALTVVTTYVAARIEDQSSYLRMLTYSFLIVFFGTGAVTATFFLEDNGFSWENMQTFGSIFLWLLMTTLIFFFPISTVIARVENWLDMSQREQIRKIR